MFHDEYNQQVHRAAPGLLGLIEARPVIGRWKPRSLAWLDGTDHFFNHLYAEFDGEPAFAPLRRELAALGEVDAPWPARNAFLFQYLAVVARRAVEKDPGRRRSVPSVREVRHRCYRVRRRRRTRMVVERMDIAS